MVSVELNKSVNLSGHIKLGEVTSYWLHFAVRPKENRRKIAFLRG